MSGATRYLSPETGIPPDRLRVVRQNVVPIANRKPNANELILAIFVSATSVFSALSN